MTTYMIITKYTNSELSLICWTVSNILEMMIEKKNFLAKNLVKKYFSYHAINSSMRNTVQQQATATVGSFLPHQARMIPTAKATPPL